MYEVHSNPTAEDDEIIIKLTFEPVIHITLSMFSITVVDVITSLGGSVRNKSLPEFLLVRSCFMSQQSKHLKAHFVRRVRHVFNQGHLVPPVRHFF